MTGAAPGDLVVVVGAAHIDVMADYDSPAGGRVDKAGMVRYSIGGTAYNIAVNLGQYGIPTALVTVLKQPSFSSVWIRERLGSAGVHADFVQLSEHVAESGFVALRRDGQMETAVTSSAVEHYTFRRELIEQAIGRARIVVLECNLAPEQITVLAHAAQAAGRPVIVAAVSDTKVKRIGQTLAAPFDLVTLNELEARAIGIDTERLDDGRQATSACALLRAKAVVVTLGARGHCLVDSAGAVSNFPAPEADHIVSPSGAGDALLAGIVAHAFRHGLDPAAASDTAALLVRKVLRQAGATAGSLAVDADFARLAKIAIREGPWFNRFLTQEVGVAATVLFGVITLVFTMAQLWYAKRADDNSAVGAARPASAAPPARDGSSIVRDIALPIAVPLASAPPAARASATAASSPPSAASR